jgi:tripartite-type tricarboxylate transporter receptor subunit TctC
MDRIPMISTHGFLAAATFLVGGSVPAQDFPNRPIRVIVTNSPGTTSDALARVLAPPMARLLAQPVIVENKAGAGNLFGFEYVAKQVGIQPQ